jgi:hypothetical protein
MPTSAALQELCSSLLPPISASFHGMEIQAEFYPYIGLTHTIRRRGAAWVIRISDHCEHAPLEVLESIIRLLASKVLRRKSPRAAVCIYDDYRRSPELEARLHSRRRARGRKRIDTSSGKYHSLEAIYRDLNRKYFNDQVEIQSLGWSSRKSWRRMGHYDPVHHTITISPVLDSPKVPGTVMSYLLYHEMLHTLFPGIGAAGRNRHHPREFHRAERAFPYYAESQKFLNRFCRTRGRGVGWTSDRPATADD